MQCEFITVTNCIINAGCNAFRIGVGAGSIRHVQISNITVERCLCALEFCTAYGPYCRANIEDVHVSGISVVEADAAFRLYAKNNAFIRDVSIENLRSSATAMNSIDGEKGMIENVKLRDVEVTVSNRFAKEQVSESQFAYRGNHILKVHNASRVILDGVKIHGSLNDCDGEFSFSECPDLIKRDCNF